VEPDAGRRSTELWHGVVAPPGLGQDVVGRDGEIPLVGAGGPLALRADCAAAGRSGSLRLQSAIELARRRGLLLTLKFNEHELRWVQCRAVIGGEV
jgi:hypothetical protein